MRRTAPVLVALVALSCASPDTNRIWARQNDCLERADRFVESLRRQFDGSTTTLGDWRVHYNAKAERCYLLLEEYHHPPMGLPIEMPYRQERIWDASERREIARFTRDTGDTDVWDDWCQLIRPDAPPNDQLPTCKAVAAFADSLMRE